MRAHQIEVRTALGGGDLLRCSYCGETGDRLEHDDCPGFTSKASSMVRDEPWRRRKKKNQRWGPSPALVIAITFLLLGLLALLLYSIAATYVKLS